MATIDSSTRRRENRDIRAALKIVRGRLGAPGVALSSVSAAAQFFLITLASRQREEFWALFVDSQNRLIKAERLFVGTLDQTAVYPREIVKRAIALNAAGTIFAHNHPSGVAEPSVNDELLTCNLRWALSLVDVKLIDHLVVGGSKVYSFASKDHAPFGARTVRPESPARSTPKKNWRRPARWGARRGAGSAPAAPAAGA